MARITIFLALAIALLLLPANRLHACACGEVPPIWKAVDESHEIFVGRVIAIEPIRGETKFVTPVFGRTVRVRMTVEERWKGAVIDTIEIYTGEAGVDCGYPFVGNRRYLVYAILHEGASITTICTRTRAAEFAESDISVLYRRDRSRLNLLTYTGLAGVKVSDFKIGPMAGIGFAFPLDSNLALTADVLHSWMMGTKPSPVIDPDPNAPDDTPFSSRLLVTSAGVRYRTGISLYLHLRGGYAWYIVESEPIRVQSSPVASTGFSFEFNAEKSARPFLGFDLVASLGSLDPRWSAFVTAGVGFDI